VHRDGGGKMIDFKIISGTGRIREMGGGDRCVWGKQDRKALVKCDTSKLI